MRWRHARTGSERHRGVSAAQTRVTVNEPTPAPPHPRRSGDLNVRDASKNQPIHLLGARAGAQSHHDD